MIGTVTITKLTRKEWLKKIPEIIYKLKKDYNFDYESYYKHYTLVKIPIQDKMQKDFKKNAHKIVLYKSAGRDNIFYLSVYSKKNPKVYVCDEYTNEGWNTWIAIKRFLKKFDLAYEGAVKYEEDIQSNKEEENNQVC